MLSVLTKIKKNKFKVALFSSLITCTIIGTTISSVILSSKQKEKNKNIYYYKPGEIRFDENGKLLIPTVIDTDNPNGIYKNVCPEISEINVPNKYKNNEEFRRIVNDQNENNIKLFKNILSKDLNKKISISKNIKMAIDNILPSNVIKLNEVKTINEFIDSISQTAIETYENKILSTSEIKDYCALLGINFNKEYNTIMDNNELDTNISLHMGGGVVSPPTNTPPSAPSQPDIDPKSITFQEQLDILEDNLQYLYIFAVTNSVVLSVLTTISITLTILSFMTAGSSLTSLILLIPEIVFASFTIVNSWQEYEYNKETKRIFEDDMIPNIILALGVAMTPDNVKEFLKASINDVLNKLTRNAFLKVEYHIDTFFNKFKFVKKLSMKALKFANISLAICSIAYSIVMEILYARLIKDIEWNNYFYFLMENHQNEKQTSFN